MEPALAIPLVATLAIAAFVDARRRIVPDALLAPSACWALAAGAAFVPAGAVERLTAGLAAFAAMLVLGAPRPGALGMGDVKLAGVMGLYLGAAVAPALAIAFLAGALAGGALIVRHGLAARSRAIPFAPFLAAGGLVALAGSHVA